MYYLIFAENDLYSTVWMDCYNDIDEFPLILFVYIYIFHSKLAQCFSNNKNQHNGNNWYVSTPTSHVTTILSTTKNTATHAASIVLNDLHPAAVTLSPNLCFWRRTAIVHYTISHNQRKASISVFGHHLYTLCRWKHPHSPVSAGFTIGSVVFPCIIESVFTTWVSSVEWGTNKTSNGIRTVRTK